ncbi:MAG TPA: PLDc N-terminal domain-containing protein [Candidatus Acidoferrales bacterium]|nr:PLDc N-terminal domain-containing protein [Candidatus Acidoferrales bacterium]
MYLSVILPNLLLFLLLATVGPWVTAIVDILRADDLNGETRIVWMLVLLFAWPVGVIAWIALRGRRNWRQLAIVLLVTMMSVLVVVTVVETVFALQPHSVDRSPPVPTAPVPGPRA